MMSGSFKGFTEKDIEKIKDVKKDGAGPPTKKSVIKNKTTQHSVTLKKMAGDQKFEIIDQKAMLKQPPVSKETKELTVVEPAIKITEVEICAGPNEANNNDNVPSENNEIICDLPVLNSDIMGFEKPINLEEFQAHQKLIEEQNRKRKEMLAKALDDRSKQTAEEAIRLDNIKKELHSLDAALSDDVSILRKQIDKASLIYSEAEKNYHRVEKEFLAAKLTLQKERERKELLTEHLCTLIAHNEDRKAKKLESLMDQLVYSNIETHSSSVSDGVCEQTGKMLEMEDGRVIIRDD